MRNSLIFSRQLTEEDIKKLYQSEKYKNNSLNPDNFGEEISHGEKINISEISDLTDEYFSLIIQKDIELLNNDIIKVLTYFYLVEKILNQNISNKYIDNDDKRHLYIRIADFLLRTNFNINESIKHAVHTINKIIFEINKSYKENNIKDLSDEFYLNKVCTDLGTKYIPLFLLREGYRIRREIEKNIININENEINKGNNDNNKKEVNAIIKYVNNKIKEDISVERISEEISNKKKQPFARKNNEIYVLLFFLSLLELKYEGIYDIIINNINEFNDYFKFPTHKNFNDLKKDYIEIDKNNISKDLILQEISELELDEYFCKNILASFYVLIINILKAGKEIYINLLFFLYNFLPDKNYIFKNIINDEIYRFLPSDTQNINYEKDNILNNNYKVYYKNNNNKKTYDYYAIKNKFNNSNNKIIKEEFNKVIKDEEAFEIGSNAFYLNVISLFKNYFKIKKSEDEDTIKNYLKLIPYNNNSFKGKNILILISGYLSSKCEQEKDWNALIKSYIKRFKNPIIYFYNWPSSKIELSKFFYHWKDFKDARQRAKYCGKLLALIIMSNDFFPGAKITLAGFSLGTHVIKYCIKELEKFGRLDILNNIIFIAGATNIKHNNEWEKRLGSISGSIINCYSDVDKALEYSKKITGKDTIGKKN